MLTRASVGERKLSHAQERNDFFNLLRKKSLNPTGSIPEPDFLGAADDLQSASSDSIPNCQPGLDCSAENGNFSTDEPDRRLYAEIEESHSYLDAVLDPEEEEAFLRSLGWDKNAGEEALSQEEIDAFLKKVVLFFIGLIVFIAYLQEGATFFFSLALFVFFPQEGGTFFLFFIGLIVCS